jgi:hypothetical protein
MTIRKSACLFLLSASAAIYADTGSIAGKVRTAAGNGAPIPTAPVQARNLNTKEIYKATSASDGSYSLSGLPEGNYEISIENLFPFLPFHQGGVHVGAGEAARLEIRLDDINLNTLGDGGEQFAQALADKPAPPGPAPRASDGKPDLSGIWQAANAKLLGDAPQPLPEAEAASKQRGKRGRLTDFGPGGCMPGGISLGGVFSAYRIVQTRTLIVLLDGGFNPDRQIYLDGRGHPKDFNPSWMGHSIGRWDGDTLVVDTVGFNDLGWIGDPSFRLILGVPQTEKLRITERFRRLDLGHLEVETSYEDPSMFKQPFTTRQVHSLAPKDEEIPEYVCNENERDVAHMKFDQ